MKTFSQGGVHPPEEKNTAKNKIENIAPPLIVYIPTLQHIGAIANPIVNVGDVVKKGQLIAESSGKVSANIHASVSGKIKSIENLPVLSGRKIPHVVIENDGLDNLMEGIGLSKNTDVMTRDEIVKAVFEAGITGMGGASFPTHIKLSPPNPIDTLIVNGAECEPYLTCDHRIMLEKADELVSGISLVMRAVGATRALIGIEANKVDAGEVLEKSIKKHRLAGIRVVLLKVKYPQGAEKQLIDALTGRKVTPRNLPFTANVLCQNVATCLAVHEACKFNMPLIQRVLTVGGDGVENAGNISVPIGTSFEYILKDRKIFDNVKKIIAGGPMMGVAVEDLNQVVTKGTSGILAFIKPPKMKNFPCIRCGRCVEVCPMGLVPSNIGSSVEGNDVNSYDSLGIPDCVECGSCSYICPAGRPLVQLAKKGKDELLARK